MQHVLSVSGVVPRRPAANKTRFSTPVCSGDAPRTTGSNYFSFPVAATATTAMAAAAAATTTTTTVAPATAAAVAATELDRQGTCSPLSSICTRYVHRVPITLLMLRVDFYQIQTFTGLFDPHMIRGAADLQYCTDLHYCTDLQYCTDLRNFTYAVEYECMACLQASRRGELRDDY